MSQDFIKNKFQERLQQLIDERNLKQKDLAKQIEVTPASISSWLMQKTIPTKKNLDKLCDYFAVTSDYLKGLTDGRTNILEIDPETGEKNSRKHIGMPISVSAENIGIFMRNLSYKEQEFLYHILNIAKNFDMDEWRSLYIIVRTLWQCRHPRITLYNPLSSFDNFKHLFYYTNISLNKTLDSSEVQDLKDFQTIKTKISDFEGVLEDDFLHIKNIFESIERFKLSIPHTDERINEIIKYLENGEYIKDSSFNKTLQKSYSEDVKKAYEKDLKDIVNLFSN